MTQDDPLARFFYETECIKGTWSVKELRRQIATNLYFRSGVSKDPKKLLATIKPETNTQAYRSESWSIPKNILYVALLLIGWELVDGFLAKKFDWVDISACIISGCLMYVLYLIFGFKRVVDYKKSNV